MALLPPIKDLEHLSDEWDKDCDIDYDRIDLELLKIPSLHSKYYRIRNHHRKVSLALTEKYRVMKELRREWIEGKSELETLQEQEWEQYQGNPITTRTAQEARLATDPVLSKILMKKEIQDEIVNICDGYIRQLKDRNYELRGVTEHRKFFQEYNPIGTFSNKK